MSELEQNRLHLFVHLVAVHVGGRRGGGLTGSTCVSQHVTGGMCRSQSSDDGGISETPIDLVKTLTQANILKSATEMCSHKTLIHVLFSTFY